MAHSAASAEWRAAWPLPLVVMLATTGASLVVYSSGVFMPLLTAAFGWSRGEFSSGFMVSTLVGLVAMPLAGRMADHWGPRPIALAGIVALAAATSALGLADGTLWRWWLSFALFSLAGSLMAPSILTAAVASRFSKARGLALAVALSGNGLAAAIWPPLATFYTARLGWRMSFAALAISWAAVTLLPFILFFHSRPRSPAKLDRGPVPVPPNGLSYAAAIRSRPFFCLALGGTLFIAAGVAILVNFVPLLRDRGIAPAAAAGMASISGLSAIVGRVLIGVLLDRIDNTRPIAVAAFALPALASMILLIAGASIPLTILAAILLGLGLGAEMDIAAFLAARYFGLLHFSGTFGIIVACYGVAAGVGPMLGSMVYDRTGTYTLLLLAAVPMLIVSAALIAALPRRSVDREAAPTSGAAASFS